MYLNTWSQLVGLQKRLGSVALLEKAYRCGCALDLKSLVPFLASSLSCCAAMVTARIVMD